MAKPKNRPQRRPGSSPSPTSSKLQRWIDLLAALLARRYPITFEELRREVPAYASGQGPTLMRMFERDKDELRAFGVPIETVTTTDRGESTYRLRSQDFYLPFVAVAESGPRDTRPPVPPQGYRSLTQLTFEPDQLQMIAQAAARVRQLGDPELAADADRAVRKLTFDLPPDAFREDGPERVLADPVDAETFSVLAKALLDRKVVTFDYHAMSSDDVAQREVEPYGLAFLGTHWYLVARDRRHGRLRTFRVSRMAVVAHNRSRAQTPDYEIPSTFKLEEYARSRDAWALGAERPIEAVVEFTQSSGATRAAARVGQSVGGMPGHRRFQVRRVDTFARWILGFAGEARPVEPPELVECLRTIARETLALYGVTA